MRQVQKILWKTTTKLINSGLLIPTVLKSTIKYEKFREFGYDLKESKWFRLYKTEKCDTNEQLKERKKEKKIRKDPVKMPGVCEYIRSTILSKLSPNEKSNVQKGENSLHLNDYGHMQIYF